MSLYFGDTQASNKILEEIITTNQQLDFCYGDRVKVAQNAAKKLGLSINEKEMEALVRGELNQEHMEGLIGFNAFQPEMKTRNEGYLETFGAELELVKEIHQNAPSRVWTIISEGNQETIINGFHWVNRMGYLIAPPTDHPSEISFNDEWEDDDEDLE